MARWVEPEWKLKREWTSEERLAAAEFGGAQMRLARLFRERNPYYGEDHRRAWEKGWDEEDIVINAKRKLLPHQARALARSM